MCPASSPTPPTRCSGWPSSTRSTGRAWGNFSALGRDREFWNGLRASLLLVLMAVPLRVAAALLLALLLARRGRGVHTARLAAYVPSVIPDAAYALLWLAIFNPVYGPSLGELLGAGSRSRVLERAARLAPARPDGGPAAGRGRAAARPPAREAWARRPHRTPRRLCAQRHPRRRLRAALAGHLQPGLRAELGGTSRRWVEIASSGTGCAPRSCSS